MFFFNNQKRQILKTLNCTSEARQNYLDSLMHLTNEELHLPKLTEPTAVNPKASMTEVNDHKWSKLLAWLYYISEQEPKELSINFKKFLIKSRFKIQSKLNEQTSIYGWSELKHINSLLDFFNKHESSLDQTYYFGSSLNSVYMHHRTSTIDRLALVKLLTSFSEYHLTGELVAV